MQSNYEPLGKYIREVDVRNADNKEENLLGVSVQKKFVPSIANTIGTDFSKYKVVKKGQFTYIPDTSRRGDKIGIALLNDYNEGLVSNIYTVFEIKNEEEILPEYLMMWFSRPEFDRYARYKSHGSVREIFDWEELCKVQIPAPSIDEQRRIVRQYKTISDRIEVKQKINYHLLTFLQIVYKEMFSESNYIFQSLKNICSKIGSGATPKGGKTSYCREGISFIRSTNVLDYQFSYSDMAHINEEQAKALSNVTVKSDDVLFNITGVSVTRCCMVPNEILPARVNQHVMILRPEMGKYMGYYLMFTLCSNDYKTKLLGIGQSGSTREAINKKEMENFQIPVPQMNEINSFGQIAERSYSQIHKNNKEIMLLNELRESLLTISSSH